MMELESDLDMDNSVSGRGKYIRNVCRQTFKPKWLRNKGSVIVLIWSFLCFTVYHYFTIRKISRDPLKQILPSSSGVAISLGVLLPVGGWLADAFFGRYKVIRFGVWTMWFGAMLNGFSLVIGKVIEAYGSNADPWVSLFSDVIMGVGLAAFQANIVQFGIDQLIDASSVEITSVLEWYTVTVFTSGMTMYFSSSCVQEYAAILVVAVFLTLAIGADFLFSQWLSKEQVISNPLPLVLKVVCYTIKNKLKSQTTVYLEQQGVLSTFNIAKRVYNGPFTSEQVEDVKTFFRVLAVVVIFTIVSSGSTTVNDVSHKMAVHLQNRPTDDTIKGCYHGLSISYATFTYSAVVMLIYLTVMHPFCHSCIARVKITIKFFFSVLIFLAAVLALLGIESASYLHEGGLNQTSKCHLQTYSNHPEIDIDVHWMIMPNTLNGLSMFLFILSGIEFICAQAPYNMKGLLLGIACSLFGLGALIHGLLSEAFTGKHVMWNRAPLTCGIWYFVAEGVIVLIGFIVMVVIIKKYKRRERISTFSQQESVSY